MRELQGSINRKGFKMTNTQFGRVQVFSEDIAEIRNAIYQFHTGILKNSNTKRMDELTDIMNDIYDYLFMDGRPVLLLDKDGANMNEYK